MSGGTAAPAVDPGALIRSKEYRRLLVIACLVGLVVSFASWCFLEAVYWIQQGVYVDLPSWLGFADVPWWWPIPVLTVAGLLTVVAVLRLPGTGGHIPYKGISAGQTRPVDLPGILLAGLASLGLGLVLGPEAPLIALGTGLAIFAVKRARKDAPDQVVSVIAAAAAFAAIATIFGSPVVGAVILIEAAGLGGPMLPLVLLPGLMAAGIGSLVFIGMDGWAGLSNSDYALSPFTLPAYTSPTLADFVWAAALALLAALVTIGIVKLSAASAGVVGKKPWVLIPGVAIVVALLAIGFAEITNQSADVVLFSGENAFDAMFAQATTLSLGTLALLLVCKAVAWGLSMGSFRGGPTFPALFVGAVGGLLAAHLPGFSETPAVAALMAATAVSILRLPLSCVVIAMLLTSQAGPATAPIIIVAVVVAYIAVETVAPKPKTAAPNAGTAV
ncbi:MAG: chloride channel protein [Actinomycetes bacterium]